MYLTDYSRWSASQIGKRMLLDLAIDVISV